LRAEIGRGASALTGFEQTMSLLLVVAGSAVLLALAYGVGGWGLSRLLRLNDRSPTPAHQVDDGIDFVPLPKSQLLPQHFSAIAAAGPIVGPILAGQQFGWLPALLWILGGAIFIGGVHDLVALVASVRHQGRSIAEVVREHVSRTSFILFLIFIWLALVYIIVAFTDVTAAAFIGPASEANGGVSGGSIATASLIYLTITLGLGLFVHRTGVSLTRAALPCVILVALAILISPQVPLDLSSLLGWSESQARKFWDAGLLVYCLIAGILPVWLLLQPRGQLGGYFLYAALAAGAGGLLLGGEQIKYPAFRGWAIEEGSRLVPLVPFLFITIACGACSGFHGLIASGTSSKQLNYERDARVVGYGAMLLEAMVAIVSLCCVMMFAEGSAELKGTPNQIYARGIGNFCAAFGIPMHWGIAFALMAFTTFIYDTLDVCTRLGRYILQELTGWTGRAGTVFATSLTAGVPLYFLLRHPADAPQPVWRAFWNLFGASNQLLAALTLLCGTVWLWRTRRAAWVWLITGIPTVLMYVMSTWALWEMTWRSFRQADGSWAVPNDPVPWVGIALLTLAGIMLIDAIRVLIATATPPTDSGAIPANGPAVIAVSSPAS
jgi:carbon starvation protein